MSSPLALVTDGLLSSGGTGETIYVKANFIDVGVEQPSFDAFLDGSTLTTSINNKRLAAEYPDQQLFTFFKD